MNLSDSISSQSFFSDLGLSFNYSILQQDERLFNLPGKKGVIENSKNIHHDHEYGILLSKCIFEKGRFALDAGIGYSLYVIKFQRPFDHRYFTNYRGTEDVWYIKKYLNHRIKLTNELNLKLFGTYDRAVNFAVPFNINMSLNKNISAVPRVEESRTFNKWRAELSNLEIYSGIKYVNKYANIAVYFRVFNIQKVDRVIFYNMLWGHSSDDLPKIKDNEFEIKNWSAFQIKFGLMLGKQP